MIVIQGLDSKYRFNVVHFDKASNHLDEKSDWLASPQVSNYQTQLTLFFLFLGGSEKISLGN